MSSFELNKVVGAVLVAVLTMVVIGKIGDNLVTTGGGHGGGVGPALDGISERGVEHVLASMLSPQAEIADGFATITVTRRDGGVVTGLLVGDDDEGLRLDVGEGQIESIGPGDVAARTTPTTGMPAMGLVLPARDLRDVVAYVMSLSLEETADE